MILKYVPSESTVEPSAVEFAKTTVYIRKDIKKEAVEIDDLSVDYWRYQEAALSYDDFRQYSDIIAVQNAANIEKILEAQEAGDSNQLTIMEAIADLYEMIATSA